MRIVVVVPFQDGFQTSTPDPFLNVWSPIMPRFWRPWVE